MPQVPTNGLRFPATPFIPIAPTGYDSRYTDQSNNVLRLYFNQIVNLQSSLLGTAGGQYIDSPTLVAFNQGNINLTGANIPTVATFTNTGVGNGPYVDPDTLSRIYVVTSGIYTFSFFGQLRKTSAAASSYIDFWVRVNGDDLPYSAVRQTVPNQDFEVISGSYSLSLVEGDYFEVVFASSDATIYLPAIAGSFAPYSRPSGPSIGITVAFSSFYPQV